MPPKRKGLTSKKMAEAREEGGIDVLPDALLQHILSFLSADEAVKTSASYPAAGATPPLEIHAHPAYCQNGGQMGLGELRGFQQHTHIYAPNLITLHLDILWGRVPFLKSIPSLLTGFVRAQQDCDDYCSNTYSGNCENCNGCLCMIDETGNDSAKCMLLGGLLEAKNLELIAEPEMLQISKDTKSMIETEENYNVLVKPVVTSKHLKVVKVHCTEVDEGVYKIVKFLTTLNIEVIMKRMDRSTKLKAIDLNSPPDEGDTEVLADLNEQLSPAVQEEDQNHGVQDDEHVGIGVQGGANHAVHPFDLNPDASEQQQEIHPVVSSGFTNADWSLNNHGTISDQSITMVTT
ncbi:hypothetical protein OsJ_33318 [Oryza sativa Japonica Group]|uniref:Uncharacterized protein n=1 Tax=Oryza sativa subsp. japonica TaxID=39947 RepID=B9G9X5_ORYSJ|nr:hypothetical protein OsJ_33318 [Oryza sativa Japonica Group]